MKTCPLCQRSESIPERELNGIQLVRCPTCSFVYANLTEEDIAAANAKWYDGNAAARYALYQTPLNDAWFDMIAADRTSELGPGRVLDIGCGNGRLLAKFRARGWECHGVDPAPWSREFAGRVGFTLHQGTIETTDFGSLEFDLITSTSTLEHLSTPLAHLDAAVRLLRPGGVAYFCGVPNYGSAAVRLGVSKFWANKPPQHVNYFTPRSLMAAIDRLETSPSRASVRTYGIPGLHRLYNLATRRIKTAGRKQSSWSPKSSDARTNGAGTSRSVFNRLILGAAVRGPYLAGRPFGLGDKLEITLMR